MIEIILLAVSLLLVLMCGIFVAAEFSLIAVDRPSVERLAEKGDKKAQGIVGALKSLSSQLSGAQVGITITNLGIGFLAEPAISSIIKDPLLAAGVSSEIVPGLSIILGITIATIITMVFGELVPKNLALAKPIATAKLVAGPQKLFTYLMRHPIHFLNSSANVILKKLGVKPQEELASARSADELVSLVRRSAEKGTLPKETAAMMERSLSFSEHTVLDVMTPRVRMHSMECDATVAEMLTLARKSGLSRFPVTGKDLDDILGVVHIKHAIAVQREKRDDTKVRHIMKPPVFVPASIQLESLMEALKSGGMQMAVVVDEFGGTDGIVTIEDLLEELVGEVHDEHDRTRQTIRKRAENTWVLSGLLRPDEIGEELELFLPEEEDFETIAGLVVDRLGHIPVAGEKVNVDAANREGKIKSVVLKVERMDGLRIDRVEMSVISPAEDTEGLS